MAGRRISAFVAGGCIVASARGCDSGRSPQGAASDTRPVAPPSAIASPAVAIPPRIAALGDTGSIAPELRRAFDVAAFDPMPEPGPDDWLAQHPEKPQSFADYLRAGRNAPDPQRPVIYLLPVGEFPASAPTLPQLAELVHAFFALEVRTLPAVKVGEVTGKTRINALTGKRQLFAPDVLAWLKARLPSDAFGLLAVTMADLYPDPAWNFVFGMASLAERVGVQSLARQDPAFFGERRPRGWQLLARRRAAWTLLHETSHMFGLTHCTYWRCVVAGANSQDEADRSPLHPCPVCLRKLHSALRFDPAAREEAVAAALGRLGIADEAAWASARATWIRRGVRSRR